MSTPAIFRALAARVLAEQPNEDLLYAIWAAIGWTQDGQYWQHKDTPNRRQMFEPVSPLYSLDGSAAMLPEGWSISRMDHGYRDCVEVDAIKRGLPTVRAKGHDEKAARTVLALEAMAVDAEYHGQPMAWDEQA